MRAIINEQGAINPEFIADGLLVTGFDAFDPGLPHGQGLVAVTVSDGFVDEEVDEHDMNLLNAYVRFLAPPNH